jgi:hypothetical protein
MNKVTSGILAIGIYLALLFLILLYYNVHKIKSKNYVEKNANRVTVTLVNSDKTVFNKSSKITIPKKPTPKRHHIKRVKYHAVASAIPKKTKIKQIVPSKKSIQESKKIVKANVKREQERKRRLARIKREKEKKKRERLARIKREKEKKERSKNLFSSIKIHNSPRKEPRRVHTSESRVRHTSRVVDRIKNTHQNGRVSNRNRERGIVNAYIAKVKQQLNNWNAQSNYKGQSATIKLTIMSSGHFRYRVRHSSSGELTRGLKRFLDQLNRIGLGQHHKSTPYIIEVTFRAK